MTRRFSDAVAVRNAQLDTVNQMTDRHFLILVRNAMLHKWGLHPDSPFVVRLQQIIERTK